MSCKLPVFHACAIIKRFCAVNKVVYTVFAAPLTAWYVPYYHSFDIFRIHAGVLTAHKLGSRQLGFATIPLCFLRSFFVNSGDNELEHSASISECAGCQRLPLLFSRFPALMPVVESSGGCRTILRPSNASAFASSIVCFSPLNSICLPALLACEKLYAVIRKIRFPKDFKDFLPTTLLLPRTAIFRFLYSRLSHSTSQIRLSIFLLYNKKNLQKFTQARKQVIMRHNMPYNSIRPA